MQFHLKVIAACVCVAGMTPVCAQADAPAAEPSAISQYVVSSELAHLTTDVRVDWQREWTDGDAVDENSGFKGRYIMLRLDGTVLPGLSYSWRQRLNRATDNSSFFDQTDWLYVQYRYRRFNFSAGKEIVAMGGWEYDRYPVDSYSASLFWENLPCFQFGATAGIDIGTHSHLNAQVTQGMWHNVGQNSNTYTYNLMWTGKYGIYRNMSSVNMMEYAPGKFINYIVVGNRVDLGPWTLEADVMNRAARHQTLFGKDMSVIAELSRSFSGRWRVFGKYTYDVNKSGTDADLTVADGTELNMAGAGVEFCPFAVSRTSLRLHANCFYAWGKNANAGDVMQNKSVMLNVGVRWFMDIFSVKK